jgi:pimeloyl-ACP methyl ester carboxylesterase
VASSRPAPCATPSTAAQFDNLDALRNPGCLDAIRRHPALAPPDGGHQAPPPLPADLPLILQLQAIWERIFGIVPIGLDDNFFDLGGRSLLAFILFTEIRKLTGRAFPVTTIFEAPTIAGLAAPLRDDAAVGVFSCLVCLVCLRREGAGRPLFIMHGFGGNVLELAKPARFLRCDRPVYALQARGLDPAQEPHDRIEDMAEHYLGEIRALQPRGPYALAGFSTGGLVAFEMARRLVRGGEVVEFVGLLDSEIHERNLPPTQLLALQLKRGAHVAGRLCAASPARSVADMWRLASLRSMGHGFAWGDVRASVCRTRIYCRRISCMCATAAGALSPPTRRDSIPALSRCSACASPTRCHATRCRSGEQRRPRSKSAMCRGHT